MMANYPLLINSSSEYIYTEKRRGRELIILKYIIDTLIDFKMFCSSYTSLKYESKTRRLSDLNQDALRELVECYPGKSTRVLALDLNVQSTIYNHLKKIEQVSKLGVRMPHSLSEKNQEVSISILTSLLSSERNELYLKNTNSGGKEWIFYDISSN